MPDLYLRKAVSNGDRDALASHVRNRLQSHHDDRWQDSLRHFSSVARLSPKGRASWCRRLLVSALLVTGVSWAAV